MGSKIKGFSRSRSQTQRSRANQSSHGRSVAAATSRSCEEEGDSGPKAQAQGRKEGRPATAGQDEEGPPTSHRRRQVHSVEVTRPCPLRLAR